MDKVNKNVWHIKSEDPFFEKCEYAKESMLFAEAHGNQNGIRWFFSECYANWKDNNHTVIFKSYITPEYKNLLLAIKVRIHPNKKYTFTINKEAME